jgi:hypothetical protein
LVIKKSPGFGPISGTISAQSGGGVCAGITASATGRNASFPSGDGVTRAKNTGMPFFLKAAASAAAFFITLSDAYGAVCRPTIPFCKSMTTNAVFDRSMNILLIRHSPDQL